MSCIHLIDILMGTTSEGDGPSQAYWMNRARLMKARKNAKRISKWIERVRRDDACIVGEYVFMFGMDSQRYCKFARDGLVKMEMQVYVMGERSNRKRKLEIPEELFHGVWAVMHRFVDKLHTVEGKELTIQNPGVENHDAGPDFFNARLTLNGQQWAGDVELHINESDWYAHGHDVDPVYDSVILHVVVYAGRRAVDSKGRAIPTLVVPHADELVQTYGDMMARRKEPCCGSAIGMVSSIEQTEWMLRLLVERLQTKSDDARHEVEKSELGWEEAFLRSVAQSLGQRVNAEPMLWLMRSTPLKTLWKIRDGWFSLEALLFGQSGLLGEARRQRRVDSYVEALEKEYYYQTARFGLTPISGGVWKHLRVRPSAFPALRIAQLAAIIYRSEHLFASMLNVESVEEVNKLLRVEISDYWLTHYTLGDAPSAPKSKKLGYERAKVVLINSVVPYRFAYGVMHGDEAQQESAIDLLEQVDSEENALVNCYRECGVRVRNAVESQAIVEMLKKYCRPRLCYRCPVGVKTLTSQLSRHSEEK